MYFDRRLWQLTYGLRRWIALAVLLGLIASVVGIARFAIIGVLLSHVFNGAGFFAVAVPAAGVVVETMVALVLARAALEKFGGDSLTETRRNIEAYQRAVADRESPAARGTA